jgi:N-acetylneuraminic acid mutarotase
MTVTADNKMYVFGGYIDNGFTPIKRVDVYDPATNQWTRLADSDMPIGLTHSGCTLLGRDVIIAGGYPAKPGGNQTFSTTAVYDFNLDTHVWTTLPSLPAARGGGALVALGSTLHFIGGSDSNRKDANSHWTFTPSAAGPGAGWATAAPLPTNRNHLGAVALNGKIWVVGGQQNQDAAEIPQAALEVYDPATDTWAAKTPLPFGRSHIAAATLVVNGRIVTLGGEKTFNSVVANVSAYDPATDQWTEMTALPATRNSGVAAFINGELIYSTGRFATTTYRGTIS